MEFRQNIQMPNYSIVQNGYYAQWKIYALYDAPDDGG